MKATDALIVSPLFFLQPSNRGVVARDAWRNQRFRRLAAEVLDLLGCFLEPTSVATASQQGISEDAIAAALDAGLLVSINEPGFKAAMAWENNRWTRAAYLFLTQQDLPYTELTEQAHPLEDLVAVRRETIRSYLKDAPYPEPYLAEPLKVVELPEPELPESPDLDALLRRQSSRAFASTPVPLETLAAVLYEATQNVRIADASKASGDPFFLLNSFYTWLHVYVVVQGVEGLNRGSYQYDARRHQLRAVRFSISDADISSCIQHQYWIGGAGVCFFYCVQWDRYAWVYRHARAYINLLIQLGEIGQEVLQSSYRRGLAGWPTPAVHETRAGALLALPEGQLDAMYFMKIGPQRGGA